jgi:L-fucose mutarotase/ribose pyranase (RbsD/FucU family)
VKNYVKGCHICQENKIRNHPPENPIHLTDIPNRPFQILTTDFIMDLPESNGFNAISVYVDRFTKMVFIIPTVKEIDSIGLSRIFIDKVFPYTRLLEKLISDRGPQFASKVIKAILSVLGIKSSLSTAYYPQTNGQTERYNQELEQYLQAFCNFRQDDWTKWLPLAQFAHNSQVSTATNKSPFQALYGFNPMSYPPLPTIFNFPSVERQIQDLEHI